jgi:uncharacterized membrane protein SirB2
VASCTGKSSGTVPCILLKNLGHILYSLSRSAKLIGLLVYIGLGMVALRPGRAKRVRAVAWVAALATVAWIISVAITKNPLGFFTPFVVT